MPIFIVSLIIYYYSCDTSHLLHTYSHNIFPVIETSQWQIIFQNHWTQHSYTLLLSQQMKWRTYCFGAGRAVHSLLKQAVTTWRQKLLTVNPVDVNLSLDKSAVSNTCHTMIGQYTKWAGLKYVEQRECKHSQEVDWRRKLDRTQH